MAHNHWPVGPQSLQSFLTSLCYTAGVRAMEGPAPPEPGSGGTPTAKSYTYSLAFTRRGHHSAFSVV